MNAAAVDLSSVLVKPAGPDCNMECRYCFYLQKAELFGGHRHRMSGDVLESLVHQVMTQGGREVAFVWQGGEPTLMGPGFFRRATQLQQRFSRGQVVGNALQTNGVLIDGEWTELLAEFDFLVGLSLDGPEEVHDHYRRRHDGRGSWQSVMSALKRLQQAGVAVNALAVLSDVSVRSPEEIYCFFRDHELRHMQFIPCLEPDPADAGRSAPFCPTPEALGEFFCRLFDCWQADFEQGMPTTSVRLFDTLVRAAAGEPAPECALMVRCGNYLVVEHDGDVYSCDFYVDAEHRLGNVLEHSLSALLNSEQQRAFGAAKAVLPRACQQCQWLTLCRGGCTRHRGPSAEPSAPETKSVYCEAYRRLFHHAERPIRGLARRWQASQVLAAGLPVERTAAAAARSKIGRNAPCPCGSGRKYKRCCGLS